MPKKRQTRPGKPFIEWCAENGKRGERLANEFREELPTELTFASNYKAKWKCLKCKHVWRAQVCNRTKSDRPNGCPKCCLSRGQGCQTVVSRTNNFLAWCEKNGELGKKLSREYVDKDKPPTAVTKASMYKALWKCSNVECKHVWRTQVCNRTRSNRPGGCPMCANNAPASKTNNFLAWCEKNGELGKKLSREYVDKDKLPTAVTKASRYKAKWRCSNVECKHVWRAEMCNRTRSNRPNGCPECANHRPLSKTNNFLAWCEKNGELGKKLSREYVDKDKPPTELTFASHYKAKWKCLTCKHVWRAGVSSRTNNVKPTGCPKCNLVGGSQSEKRERDD
jgi:hypothetical protein